MVTARAALFSPGGGAKAASEVALIETLSSAHPDQWGTLLETVGASVRSSPAVPGYGRQQDPEAPCTITSLLDIMEREQPANRQIAAAESRPGGAPHNEKAASLQAKLQKRKAAKAAEATTGKLPEDTRDLDELLRDLGERPAGGGEALPKGKKKQKAPGKQASQQPEKAEKTAAPEATCEAAAPAAVQTKEKAAELREAAQAREREAQKANAQAAEEREDAETQEPPEEIEDRGACSEDVDEELELDGGRGGAEEQEQALEEEANPWVQVRTKASKAAERSTPSLPTSTVTSPTLGPAKEANLTTRGRSPLREATRRQRGTVEEETFNARPSVGTWLGMRPRASPPPADLENSEEVVPESSQAAASSSSRRPSGTLSRQVSGSSGDKSEQNNSPALKPALPVEDRRKCHEHSHKPSVGTWLRPHSPCVTPLASSSAACDPARSSSPAFQKGGRSPSGPSSGPSHLWPSTPDATPSPHPGNRHSSGLLPGSQAAHAAPEAVWMPIPLHLVGEVQQLLWSRGASSSHNLGAAFPSTEASPGRFPTVANLGYVCAGQGTAQCDFVMRVGETS
eukprot:TRINITY_DN42066_c0_g1_i1.p1 TRINITY_DN42066_c0_g1~~TRINITY_DN42066_c0_g1_i1.p1  ORF type:complete len:570 (+),score=152.67 TRINITY_DN42066_c0_g1_i1:84-1793(+)